jgi:hypothetical protein
MAKIKFNAAGFRALLSAPGVVADIERRAQAIARAANADGDHIVDVGVTRKGGRARAAVITADYRAIRAEADRHNLTRAIDAGRG